MGIRISHDAWNGPAYAYGLWRKALAEAAGWPPLELLELFWIERGTGTTWRELATAIDARMPSYRVWEKMPLRWERYDHDPLYLLLFTFDEQGYLTPEQAARVASRLTELEAKLPPDDAPHEGEPRIADGRFATRRFVQALRRAVAAREALLWEE